MAVRWSIVILKRMLRERSSKELENCHFRPRLKKNYQEELTAPNTVRLLNWQQFLHFAER